MGMRIVTTLLVLSMFWVSGCDNSDSDAAETATIAGEEAQIPITREERQEAVENSLNAEVVGGSECLSSPLAGTCFDILHNSCFKPEGACVEEASGQDNVWTWENNTKMVYDYAGLDETNTIWSAAMTGFDADGEVCIQGVMQIKGMEGKRSIILQIGDETIERIDLFNGSLPATQYICSDGSNFTVEVNDMALADACMFGPNAKPCGFLKPAALEFEADDTEAVEEEAAETEEAEAESE